MDLPALPHREPSGHKGTFGTVAVVGGCASTRAGMLRMIGAPVLSARGALRAGAGLVRLVMPAPILDNAIASLSSVTGVALPVDVQGEIIGHEAAAELDRQLGAARCLVLGPGLGIGAESGRGAARAASADPEISIHETSGPGAMVLRAVQQDEVPVVLDADGLNLLAAMPEFWRDVRAPLVLTPHPGEYRRLASALNIAMDPTETAARPEAAAEMARRVGAIVVLKGAGTVVSDGLRTWVCSRGHSCMATGGTGDVLAGIIGGLVSQFVGGGPPAAMIAAIPEKYRKAMQAMQAKVEAQRGGGGGGGRGGGSATPAAKLDLFDAARLGVEIHGIAGEVWAKRRGETGLLAEELADLVPEVMEGMRVSRPPLNEK